MCFSHPWISPCCSSADLILCHSQPGLCVPCLHSHLHHQRLLHSLCFNLYCEFFNANCMWIQIEEWSFTRNETIIQEETLNIHTLFRVDILWHALSLFNVWFTIGRAWENAQGREHCCRMVLGCRKVLSQMPGSKSKCLYPTERMSRKLDLFPEAWHHTQKPLIHNQIKALLL